MSRPRRRFGPYPWLALAAIAVVLLADRAAAAPPRQANPACRWEKLTTITPQGVYFAGAAWDPVGQGLYLVGGLDQENMAKRVLQAIRLADPDIRNASAATINVAGIQKLWGSAGAFRQAGDESAAFFFGGAGGNNDGNEGVGDTAVQTYTPTTGAWANLTEAIQPVTLAAAAYDPGHDNLVLMGGVRECNFIGVHSPAGVCRDGVATIFYLTFDPATGQSTLRSAPNSGGPGVIFGGSLVYDSLGQRMLYFGGTDNGESGRGKSGLFVLDLKDPNLGKARWAALETAGTPPQGRAFHAAAYHAALNWMIIYGGASQNFFKPTEANPTNTWALDLNVTPPKWINLGQSTPGERVGAVMVYDTGHQVPILVGGRRSPGAEPNQMNVSRDIYFLNCGTLAPTPTPGPATPTPTPGASTTPTVPGPTATAGTGPTPVTPKVCPNLRNQVPEQVQNDALANPERYNGWGQLANPAVPPSPANPVKSWLGLYNPNVPYNPIANNVAWKAGCR